VLLLNLNLNLNCFLRFFFSFLFFLSPTETGHGGSLLSVAILVADHGEQAPASAKGTRLHMASKKENASSSLPLPFFTLRTCCIIHSFFTRLSPLFGAQPKVESCLICHPLIGIAKNPADRTPNFTSAALTNEPSIGSLILDPRATAHSHNPHQHNHGATVRARAFQARQDHRAEWHSRSATKTGRVGGRIGRVGRRAARLGRLIDAECEQCFRVFDDAELGAPHHREGRAAKLFRCSGRKT
jgi:hypothetical protein